MTDYEFKIGDRVITTSDGTVLNSDYFNLKGTITDLPEGQRRPRVQFDDKKPPKGHDDGWLVPLKGLVLLDETLEEEINSLYGIGPKPPNEASSQVELLEHIDRALRGGKLVRANLAFEFLLKSLDLTRLDLPSYVHDMQEDK